MATQAAQALEPAVEKLQINGENPSENSEDVVKHNNNKWDIPLEDVYKLAVRFYKEKDGTKAIQLTYKDRVKLMAYTKQVLFGKYRPDISPEVGFLDVVGNDRRQAWSTLGDISKVDAMTEFVKYLDQLCPLFTPYIDAHKAEKAEQQKQMEEENERVRREDEEKERSQYEEEARQRQEDDRNRQLQQEMAIRAALNQQTAIQFKQYAEQQSAGNTEQQEALITQLQEQHFQQYMQQVYQQQLLHQQQQYQQLKNMADSQSPSDSQAPTDTHTDALTDALTDTHTDQLQEQQNNNTTSSTTGTPDRIQPAQVVTGNGVDPSASPGAQALPNAVVGHRKSSADDGDGDDEDEETDPNLPPIAAASMWTRKDIKEFKDSIKKDPDSLIKVGSGETVTVRVPTHEDGTCLFWEFATDSYDIGFGVYFEWTIAPNNQVSVHVSESSDEEDLEDEEGDPSKPEGDLERGKKQDNRPPTDEIIPVYRRDCHEEVYCGSHMYPGRGVYLLKFDNSYSLWRSKSLYYRVYYTR